MNIPNIHLRELPDIASEFLSPDQANSLDWVGMQQIHLPLAVVDTLAGTLSSQARVQSYVDLQQSQAKGIHMSRLYLSLVELADSEPLTIPKLQALLQQQLADHQGLSGQAMVQFEFDVLLKRPALLSNNSGWKAYPTILRATLADDQFSFELGVTVPYSSTCPCSAALSRQLLQQAFEEDFANQQTVEPDKVSQWLASRGSLATPHSQRSYAMVWTKLNSEETAVPISQLINTVEQALQTPVQTAVKREDEQEFARRNGSNLMFCEDAARRLKKALSQQPQLMDFWLQVDHQESLHAHNATAFASKGIAGGYRPVVNVR